ncbi:MAG: YccF domain-containing protein [Acholeplasma sp.]|nr:YccF domain-containing protein [Acholeplasma sp.]
MFGGLLSALGWLLLGLIFCITIMGIPLGKQMFKFSRMMLTPFGSDIQTDFYKHPILNILWLVFVGWEMTIAYLGFALLSIITII